MLSRNSRNSPPYPKWMKNLFLGGVMQKKMKSMVSIPFLVLLWPAFSWAQFDLFNAENYNIEVEGRYWNPKLASTLKVVENGIGTEFDAVNDLGFDERKGFGEGRLQIK